MLGNAEFTAYGYRLPVLELLRTADKSRVVGHLGPDLLGPDRDPAEAVRRLTADPARPLGEALLDQRNLAGIGNVYESESAFLAAVTSWLPVGDVGPGVPERLVATAHRLLEADKDRPDRRTTATRQKRERLYVYGREGRPCPRCGTSVRKAESADRVTYRCPACRRGGQGARAER